MLLNQITLDVRDLEVSAQFYELLGMKRIVWSLPDKYARFECPMGIMTLSLHVAQNVTCGGAALYFETEKLDARVEELKAKGLRFDDGPQDKDWRWREAWTRDPDGRRICLYYAGVDRRYPPWRVSQ